ncbi:MAG: tripartite tricarboxylate transporter TctB family protein [Nitrospirota bacterium]
MTSPIRNPKDFWTGIIYIVFGTAAIIIARDYGMGSALKMGPAYFPMVLSVMLILIGVASLVRSFIRPGSPISRYAFKGLLLVTASTVLFGLVVRGAGLVIALPLLVIISSYASHQFRWKYSLAMAAGLTVFCILIFLKGLGVPLPMLGSWFGR